MSDQIQRDLFRSPYHAIFVHRDGSPSPVMGFQDKGEMRKVVLAKMRRDGIKIAYTELCAWIDDKRNSKVISLERIYYGDKAAT